MDMSDHFYPDRPLPGAARCPGEMGVCPGAGIIDHRDAIIIGFSPVGDLRAVSGIGEKTFQSLAPLGGP